MFWNKKVDARRELEQRRYEYVEIVLNHHNQKLDLILDHLNLEYVPETERKEPAKLVEKKKVMTFQEMYPGITISCYSDSFGIGADTAEEPKKKKRGRPKKKK